MRFVKAIEAYVSSLNLHHRYWRLATRIVMLSLALLLLVQLAGFEVLRYNIEHNARAQVTQDLLLGERVWQRMLDQNGQRLRLGASVLAADFGFRAAVTSGDTETIQSALENHGARIGAAVTALLDTQFKVLAVSGSPEMGGNKAVLPKLTEQSWDPSGSNFALIGKTPYQFVVVPLRTPLVIGWVVMGFPVGQKLVDEMRALSGLHVSLLSQHGVDATTEVVASTLVPAAYDRMMEAAKDEKDVSYEGDTLMARTLRIKSGDGEIQTVLLRSVEEVKAPFKAVQVVLAVITVVGLLLFGIGSAYLARRVTTPLRSLVRATERLGKGELDAPIKHIERHDEFGDLAKSFETMRVNIATHQTEINQLAYWDRLTGLPNRVRFHQTLTAAIQTHKETGKTLSVVFLDLDRIKHVNEVLGYHFGDQLLQTVAERLQQTCWHEDDIVGRLGGDEFAVLLMHSSVEHAVSIAQRIAQSFETPMTFDDHTVDIGAGIGIACYPAHAENADQLLSHAEVAMYAAKHKTTEAVVYDPALDSSSAQTLSLLSELRQAVEQGELRLFLQPKVALTNNAVVGAEALVRWQHPVRGLVPPMMFIPFAEQTGFVRHLTIWMLEEAARRWNELQTVGAASGTSLTIAINLSTRDLLDQNFPTKLDAILMKHNIPAQGLCLEITESAIMEDPQRAENTLNQLHDRGFKLSIDDFGTGYSSLAYLKRLPVAQLKIDKSFVMNMQSDANDATIVRSTIDLAHNLGLSVVAEGVENEAICVLLRKLNCDEAQGYHLSRPMPVEDFITWHAQWVAKAAAAEALIDTRVPEFFS